MTLKELRSITQERIITHEKAPWGIEQREIDTEDAREYVVRDIKINADEHALEVIVTHRTFLIR